MQDRFKFRVWVKDQEEYIQDEAGECHIMHSGELICGDWIDDGYCGHYDYFNDDEVIVEQCTGLKDKNGKLIYDNDYIRVINQDTKDRPDLQVGHIWVDELNCRWIKFAKEELSWNEFCSLIDYDLTLEIEIEIIGNIHENADLLENKDE